MELSREAIVEGLQQILGPEHVVTDEQVLEAEQHRQLPQAREHLRRLHAAGAGSGGDGREHGGGRGGARLRAGARDQRRPAHRWHRNRGRPRDRTCRTRSSSTARA